MRHVVTVWLVCCRYVVNGETDAVSPKKKGTKVCPYYVVDVEGGEQTVLKLRLTNQELGVSPFGKDFDVVFADRIREADDFYNCIIPSTIGPQQKLISRQAYAGERHPAGMLSSNPRHALSPPTLATPYPNPRHNIPAT